MKIIKGSLSDAELLAGLIKGDERVLHYLYQNDLPRITSFIKSNSGSADDAMDVFQESIMVLYRKFHDEGAELSSSLYTYLFAICKNLWLKELRKRKVRKVTSLDDKVSIGDGSDEIEEVIRKNDRMNLYKAKFSLLGDGCREVLELFFQGSSMREIAEALDISEKYARKRKFQCKEKLVDLIQADPIYKELKSDGK